MLQGGYVTLWMLIWLKNVPSQYQVSVDLVPQLTDEQLTKLGVQCLGDGVLLKKMCSTSSRKFIFIIITSSFTCSATSPPPTLRQHSCAQCNCSYCMGFMQLLHPNHICLSWCSPITSVAAAAWHQSHPLLLHSLTASISAAALRLHQLHLLLLDCIRVQPKPFWKVPALAIAHRSRAKFEVVVKYKVVRHYGQSHPPTHTHFRYHTWTHAYNLNVLIVGYGKLYQFCCAQILRRSQQR